MCNHPVIVTMKVTVQASYDSGQTFKLYEAGKTYEVEADLATLMFQEKWAYEADDDTPISQPGPVQHTHGDWRHRNHCSGSVYHKD